MFDPRFVLQDLTPALGGGVVRDVLTAQVPLLEASITRSPKKSSHVQKYSSQCSSPSKIHGCKKKLTRFIGNNHGNKPNDYSNRYQ
ncbi:MAG: TRIC cation channel family protein [Burkholderiales bacterium]|nr:TRIC cation channel family protein [Burkholderiales bacterium]